MTKALYHPTRQQLEEIAHAYRFETLERHQCERAKLLADLAERLAWGIVTSVPPGREQALALTNLQQTVMWADVGIGRERWENGQMVSPFPFVPERTEADEARDRAALN